MRYAIASDPRTCDVPTSASPAHASNAVSRIAASCGDDVVRVGVEACDDGNDDESDECLVDCTINPDVAGTTTGGGDDESSGGVDESGDATGGSSGTDTWGNVDESTGPAPVSEGGDASGFGDEPETSGCSCRTASNARGGLLGLVWIALRRRRRAA